MDCGPAVLQSVLTGFGIRASYGRLREACQTDVDGTSIDQLEAVAPQLGVAAEQVMIPADHVGLAAADALPAITVLRQPDGAAHFVVLWRRVGAWLQVMDPSTGRRWTRLDRLRHELYRHEQTVPAEAWREWAGSEAFLAPLAQRLRALGVAPEGLLNEATKSPDWRPLASLDASVRLTQSLVASGGVAPGPTAQGLVQALVARCAAQPDDMHRVVPASYWSVTPSTADDGQLQLRGAVLLQLRASAQAPTAPESPELVAALSEPSSHPLAPLWQLLRADGLLAPLALGGAMALAAAAVVLQALLLRGAMALASQLGGSGQRLGALIALLAFGALLVALELPIVRESLRYGRHLELQLRMALLARLPALPDRYFQSRSVGDMAERSHLLQAVRVLPGLAMQGVQQAAELVFTLIGLALIAPAALPWALALVALALGLPLLAQPLLAERDLRLRNHSSALHAFCLDALQGLAPARAHAAEPALQRQHEALLVPWARASRRALRLGLATSGVQGLLSHGLIAALLVQHFMHSQGVGGADLLLVYWALRLGALGQGLAGLALQYPGQRNVLMRLLEPLAAPGSAPVAWSTTPVPAPARLGIREGRVVAAGHTVLQQVSLDIPAGQHVAIVGPSGAGKSTLLALFLGWHRLAEGALLLDEQLLGAPELSALRRQTAWVEPCVQLWNRSLLDNLCYASGEPGLARLGAAVEAAQLRELLAKLPAGLQTLLGESGALLSGGEGQRVRLARAFLQSDVRLALLDEPFRGLDRSQRTALLAEARRWWQGATLLCVTHDVQETLGFTRVLVVEDGRIVEDGAPQDLAQRPSRYADLLAAEARVHAELWRGAQWRQLHMQDGRVHESAPGGQA